MKNVSRRQRLIVDAKMVLYKKKVKAVLTKTNVFGTFAMKTHIVPTKLDLTAVPVILVTQVRLLASAPEIFEEGVSLGQLAKSVGAHKCSGFSCIQVEMSFEKF